MKQRYRTLADYFEQQTETSQTELAKRLGISKSHMSLLVNGERQPSLTLALKIAELTGVPVAALAVAS